MRFWLDSKLILLGYNVYYCVKGVCRYHSGVDYAAYYQNLYAPQSGTITKEFSGLEGGNWLYFKDDYGYELRFAHLDRYIRGLGRVNEGDVMAITGNTGYLTTGPHLHAELYTPSGVRINPEEYFQVIIKAPDYLRNSRFMRHRGKKTVIALTPIPSPSAFTNDYGGDWSKIYDVDSKFYRAEGSPAVFHYYLIPDPDWFHRILEGEDASEIVYPNVDIDWCWARIRQLEALLKIRSAPPNKVLSDLLKTIGK